MSGKSICAQLMNSNLCQEIVLSQEDLVRLPCTVYAMFVPGLGDSTRGEEFCLLVGPLKEKGD